jgi:hypothetical protein
VETVREGESGEILHSGARIHFRHQAGGVGQNQRAGNPSPHIVWQDEHTDIDAGDAMAATAGTRTPAAREDAKKFLTEVLANGRRPVAAIIDEAEANRISERTLLRAKAGLGVIAKKNGLDGGWMWNLPDEN